MPRKPIHTGRPVRGRPPKLGILGDLLNAEELAKMLKVDTQALLEEARQGKIPAARVGNCFFFNRDAVVRRLLNQAREGYEEPPQEDTPTEDV